MKIYLAGPFFNDTEVKNIEYAERVLAGRGFDVFSPMRHEVRDEESGSSAWARKIFEMDRAAISEADTMNIRLEELETYDFETMPEREYHGAML